MFDPHPVRDGVVSLSQTLYSNCLVLVTVCCTVSHMLSGLEARSLRHIRHNVVSSLVTLCPSQSYVHGFLGLFSTKQEIAVSCSRPQRTATRSGLEPGIPWSVVRDVNHCANPAQGTDQLCGNRTAVQRFYFSYIDTTILQLHISEITSL